MTKKTGRRNDECCWYLITHHSSLLTHSFPLSSNHHSRPDRENIEQRNLHINKAIQIVGGLREFLDFEKGGDLSQNLAQLYDYIETRLFDANVNHNGSYVTECMALLEEVSGAWNEIRTEVTDNAKGKVAAP